MTRNSKDMEDLLFRLQRSFAPHHSLILELKQNLIAVYRNTNQPNNKILAKKINLCLDIIPILRRLEPGISRLLGISLYELHTATSAIANKQFRNGKTKEPELLKMLQESEGYLREAVAHLIYEPRNTHEGQLAKMALQDLRDLRLSIQNLVLLQEDNNTNKKHKPRGKKTSCKK
uniref:Uncharacterized protein n=1 Tax=Timema douglasi TaxID=61478 RepID=A0A7R8VQP4_TIMDO|nr:unnamed protein product [Timema douglasi]